MEYSLNLKRSKSKRPSIKSIVTDDIGSFTGHGFPHLVRGETQGFKISWSIFIFASFIGCYMFIAQSVSEYLSFDVITNIKIERKTDMPFPALTICSRHESSFSILMKNIFKCTFSEETDIDVKGLFMKELTIKDDLLRDVYCLQINGADLPRNRSKILFAEKYGYTGGLTCYMIVPDSILFFYHVSDNYLAPVYNDFNTVLPSGVISRMSFSKIEQEALSSPYSTCMDEDNWNGNVSILFEKTLATNRSYNQINCVYICFQNLHNCSSDSEREVCLRNRYDYLKGHCLKECPVECKTIEYQVNENLIDIDEHDDEHYRHIYDEYDLSEMSGVETYEKFRKKVLHFHLYYQDLKETRISQIPKTSVTNLISNIGGTLGLFMGLSLLSFVEVFLLVLKIAMIKKC